MSTALEIVYRDLEKEHRKIMQAIERLRSLDTTAEVPRRLEELRTLLIVHFGREQLSDGFYDALGERAQSRQEEIKTLINDHVTILSTLNTLIGDVRSTDPGTDADVMTRVERLIEQVSDHELREHRFAVSVLEG
ncbi:MAG: hemerythrin domain-containing protein [Gammaproteobacteria bacterium]|nr:hemerythrin domain-containing protein [Gammaproteobacteria bacterium]